MNKKKLSIILLNYNNYQDTITCCDSILKNNNFDKVLFEIIIVDNCSSNDSIDRLRQKYNGEEAIKVIKSHKNGGFGYGNNYGIQKCQGDFILMINNDTFLEKDFDFFKMIEEYLKKENIGILSGKILNEDSTVQSIGFEKITFLNEFKKNILLSEFFLKKQNKIHQDKYQEKAWISGCFMFFSKEVFELSGGFDEKIFMYAEDLDFSYRIRKLNKKNYVFSEFCITHYGGKSEYFDGKLQNIIAAKKNHFYVYEKNKIFNNYQMILVKIMNYYQAYLIFIVKKIKNKLN